MRNVLAVALGLCGAAGLAFGNAMFGTLSNFDVYNDTPDVTHGFEIELDGLSPADVVYSFSYNRYGSPQVVPFAGGTYVRWQSPYGAGGYTLATPKPPAGVIPTGGHSCWPGAAAPFGAQYPTAGCEHFGVSLRGNATATVYRWLVADTLNPGQLTPYGTNVSIPAPVWNVVPPAQPAQPPVVQAVIQAPPPEVPEQLFGDAQWVKVFVTEKAAPAELDHLVNGDPQVPDEAAEVETEWFLLQAGDPGTEALDLAGEIGPGAESVIRRYEFYKFTGSYSAEHEAMCLDGTCSAPGPGELGAYVGSQMAAVNLVAPVPEPGTLALIGLGLAAMWRLRRRAG